MRFSSIAIRNYRQYRNLDLRFEKGDHDLQIIIGDNGTGKTNLLNAFTWCLYGKEPHLGTEDKGKGEPRLNKDAILEADGDENVRVKTISVTVEIEDNDDVVRVQRELPVRLSPGSITEKKAEEVFRVTRIKSSGVSTTTAGEQAAAVLNRLLPEAIREYFFFDGEQLSNYFSETRSEAIRSAVDSISQIDSIREMRRKTDNTVKKLMQALNKTTPNLEAYTKKIEDSEEKVRIYSEKMQEAERTRDDAKRKIDELDEKLRGIPDVEEKERARDELKERLATKRETLEEAQRQYFIFARELYVDFSFYEIAKSALDAIAKMEKEKQLPPSIDNAYLQEMLVQHKCEVCNRPLNADEEEHIRDLLERFQVSSETSNILTGMRSELRRLVDRVERYPAERDRLTKILKGAEKAYQETAKELDDVERCISNCPDVPAVKVMFDRREKLGELKDQAIQAIGSHKRTRDLAANVLEKVNREYSRALREQGALDDDRAAVEFGSRAVAILDRVEKSSIAETRKLMAEETESLFKGLVWKDNKCDHIELGPGYQLSLHDKAGFSCAGTCSAAERALLALSFTLAMHDVSGFQSPLFIDTPIARASGDNRANFAETLAEVSKGKQLILTFTPDEYSEAIASVFDPIAASYLKLELDENERVVSVKGAHQ